MTVETKTAANVKQVVPFFRVTNIAESVHYYVDGLGFEITNQWVVDGKLQWCWLQYGGAALMLQEMRKRESDSPSVPDKLGVGVSICFQCEDALAIYRDVTSRGIRVSRPFVGNAMWVVTMSDPDGYRIEFESPTKVPEGTEYSEPEGSNGAK